MWKRFALSTLVLGVGLTLWAAPLPKEKEEPEKPPKKEEAETSTNNIKQIGLAWHNYESTFGTLPMNILDKEKKPLLSWRVAILPYIEQDKLYKQFKLDEPWDSENNKKLIEQIPDVLKPVRGKAKKGETFYQSFAGEHAMLLPDKARGIVNILDGTSNTFMVAEAEKPVIWTKPDDIVFSGKLDGTERPKVGGMFKGHFHVVMGDGSVRFISDKIETAALRKMVTVDGGEVVDEKEIPDSDLFKE